MVLSRTMCWAPCLDTFHKVSASSQVPSSTQVWSDVLEDLILPAASFALLAFLFLVALPFPEWLCPWLAAMFADAAAMLDVLFATLDATMFFWLDLPVGLRVHCS